MKRKTRKVARPLPEESTPSDWPEDGPAHPAKPCTQAQREEMAVGVEQSIRDLPVWKNLVERVGIKEARKLLKLGLLRHQMPDGNPKN